MDDDSRKANEKEVVACLVFNVNKYFKTLFYRELKYLQNSVCHVYYWLTTLIFTRTQLKLVEIELYSRLLAS